MNRTNRQRLATLGLAAAVLAGGVAPVFAQSPPEAVAAALAACDDPTLAKADVAFDPAPSDDDTIGYDAPLTLRYPNNQRDAVVQLEVWVNGKLQLTVGKQELQSFPAGPAGVSIPLVVKTADRDRLAADGSYALQLPPSTNNDVAVLLHTTVAGAKGGCGSARYTLATKRIGTFAIVVGFNYTGKSYALKYAQNDAAAMVKHFLDDMKLSPKDVWLVTDDASQATPDARVNVRLAKDPGGIEQVLHDVEGIADPQSSLYFYYSGHMTVSGPPTGLESYFLLPGSDPDNNATQMDRSAFLGRLTLAPFTGTIVILDACYSGSRDTQAFYRHGAPPQPGIKTLRPLVGSVTQSVRDPGRPLAILTSSTGLNPSWELDEIEHGVFTYYLLNAKPDKTTVQIGEAYDEASDAMAKFKPAGWSALLAQAPDDDFRHGVRNYAWRGQR